MKPQTDNRSGYLAELAERAERRRLLREELDHYQGEFGAFTDQEMAEAQALLHGTDCSGRDDVAPHAEVGCWSGQQS